MVIGVEPVARPSTHFFPSSCRARISLAILAGERGAPRDAVLLNAAAAIAAFEGDLDIDLKNRITAGLARASQAVDSGAALNLLNKWAALTQEISAS